MLFALGRFLRHGQLFWKRKFCRNVHNSAYRIVALDDLSFPQQALQRFPNFGSAISVFRHELSPFWSKACYSSRWVFGTKRRVFAGLSNNGAELAGFDRLGQSEQPIGANFRVSSYRECKCSIRGHGPSGPREAISNTCRTCRRIRNRRGLASDQQKS